MGKKLLMYKINFIFSIVILAVLWLFVMLYSGVKEGYSDIFYTASIFTPIILILIPKNNFKIDLTFAIITVLIVILCAVAFWEYKDGTFFINDISQIPEEERHWFSFENDLRINLMLMFTLISTLISLVLRLVYTKSNNFLKNRIK